LWRCLRRVTLTPSTAGPLGGIAIQPRYGLQFIHMTINLDIITPAFA
jgi:hypothetical protein